MKPSLHRSDLERAREIVAERLGLELGERDLTTLGGLLEQRLGAAGTPSVDAYLDLLESRRDGREELLALAERLTVGETFFFRHREHLRAFAEVVAPERLRRSGELRTLRVLSAGCASGEEPYTLAILLRQNLPACRVTIRAVDLSATSLAKAARGSYSTWALRDVPEEIRERWFRPNGRAFVLDESIRRMVSLERRNLVDDEAAAWSSESYDVIFCRNVLMYFRPEPARALVAKFAACLAPGGYLFLGHAETLRGLSDEFHVRQACGGFFYQRRAEGETAEWEGSPAPHLDSPAPAPTAVAGFAYAPSSDASWIDAIRLASERIAALVGKASEAAAAPAGADAAPRVEPSVPRPSSPSAAGVAPAVDLDPAFDLYRDGRFDEALERLRGLPPDAVDDPDAALLRAAILVNRGEVEEAQRACAEVLAVDEFNPGAHYLLALCREHAGDRDGAARHDCTAIYLDPDFAMARLHLGLLCRRSGEAERGRRELREALERLAREDAARILLFGGGFGREALMRLCADELRSCGEAG
jgi:chemotaxis protein methyltransferase CheR